MRRDNPDKNAKAIVSNLELDGWSCVGIAHRNEKGKGLPDQIVAGKPPMTSRRNHLLELKSPGGTLRQSQIDFMKVWPGCVHVASSSWEAGLMLRECEERYG